MSAVDDSSLSANSNANSNVDNIISNTKTDTSSSPSSPSARLANSYNPSFGENAVIDYSRDSPMSRSQIDAFHLSLEGLEKYVSRVAIFMEDYVNQGRKMNETGKKLANELSNREYSRVMFTNNHGELGSLSDHIIDFSEKLKQQQDKQDIMLENLQSILNDKLSLLIQELKSIDPLKKAVWKDGENYEIQLSKTLESFDTLANEKNRIELGLARRTFEIKRFNLIRKLNHVDSMKKLTLCKVIKEWSKSITDYHNFSSDLMTNPPAKVSLVDIDRSVQQEEQDKRMWDIIESRLEAELKGALPPPRSPLGAQAPVYPRQEGDTHLPEIANITTEVLGRVSRGASHKDLVHARDEGILKQGYLFTNTSIFHLKKARRRKWHRIHKGTLYYLTSSEGDIRYVPVISLKDSIVSIKENGRKPFTFTIKSKLTTNSFLQADPILEFQCENEDDLINWITAIRRCRSRFGFESLAGGNTTIKKIKDNNNDQNNNNDNNISGKRSSSFSNGHDLDAYVTDPSLTEILEKSPTCCDCSDQNITWISVNLCMTLCESCANIHRSMGSLTSRVRSIYFDEWPKPMVDLISDNFTNDKVNSIWESSIMKGWTKPKPEDDKEIKTDWIISKYRWFAFVSEEGLNKYELEDQDYEPVNTTPEITDDENLRGSMMGLHAIQKVSICLISEASKGNILGIMKCIADKGRVTYVHKYFPKRLHTEQQGSSNNDNLGKNNRPTPEGTNIFTTTALHAACKNGHANVVLFLLLNGAHTSNSILDHYGKRPIDYAKENNTQSITEIFSAYENGILL